MSKQKVKKQLSDNSTNYSNANKGKVGAFTGNRNLSHALFRRNAVPKDVVIR